LSVLPPTKAEEGFDVCEDNDLVEALLSWFVVVSSKLSLLESLVEAFLCLSFDEVGCGSLNFPCSLDDDDEECLSSIKK